MTACDVVGLTTMYRTPSHECSVERITPSFRRQGGVHAAGEIRVLIEVYQVRRSRRRGGPAAELFRAVCDAPDEQKQDNNEMDRIASSAPIRPPNRPAHLAASKLVDGTGFFFRSEIK
ncbi:unnamed protein product [Nippostrongylus brasiliensis]|uniref:Uncharacterized protein n=1 Tax=Nippostrongylus brasiliensis TaxID=27835 RepID=A0A0N4XIK2_NIPBR|nr:unnamed protein product [Nippostrongylus brasiliensis]